MLIESTTIRKALAKLHVNMKTIFDWRHKILSAMSSINDQGVKGLSNVMTSSLISVKKVVVT